MLGCAQQSAMLALMLHMLLPALLVCSLIPVMKAWTCVNSGFAAWCYANETHPVPTDLQISHKFSAQMIELFRDTFCWLPLAHVLDQRVIVVHGGLFSKDGVKLSDIRSIDRHRSVLQPHSFTAVARMLMPLSNLS